MSIFNKNNLLIHPIACKDDNKPELTGVLFKKDRTVATDSFKLIEVKNPSEAQNQADNYPELPDKMKPLNDFAKRGYIIPAKSVAKVLRNLAEVKNDSLPVLNNAIFTNTNNVRTSRIATTDLDKTDIVSVNNIEGSYPQYENIIPHYLDGKYTKATINIKYLKEVIDILSKMENENVGLNAIEIYTRNDDKPMIIKMKTADKQDVTAMIMPIRD